MSKDNYFSAIKGFAIIAVVFIHTPFICTNELESIILRQPFTFAVALFFFISGFFVKNEDLDLKGIKRILFPYLIWNFTFFLYSTIKGSVPVDGRRIINVLFFGGGFFPLYFLSVMIQLKFLTPLILKFHKKHNYSKYVLYGITPLYLCLIYFIQYKTGKQPWIYAQIFPAWFLFYYVGIVVRERNMKINMSSINLTGLLIASLVLMFLESFFIYDIWKIPLFAVSQIKYFSFLYTILIILLLIKSYDPIFQRNWLAKLGEVSFGIYLLHIPVKKIIEPFIINFPIPEYLMPLKTILIVIVTLIICYGIIILASRVINNSILRIVGLK